MITITDFPNLTYSEFLSKKITLPKDCTECLLSKINGRARLQALVINKIIDIIGLKDSSKKSSKDILNEAINYSYKTIENAIKDSIERAINFEQAASNNIKQILINVAAMHFLNNEVLFKEEAEVDLLNIGLCCIERYEGSEVRYKLSEEVAVAALYTVLFNDIIDSSLCLALKDLIIHQESKGSIFEKIVCFELFQYKYKALSELPFITNNFKQVSDCTWLSKFKLNIDEIGKCGNNFKDELEYCSALVNEGHKYHTKATKTFFLPRKEMRPDIIYIQQIEMKWYALVIGIRIYNSKDPIPFEHSKNGSHTDNLASTDLKNAYTKKKKC